MCLTLNCHCAKCPGFSQPAQDWIFPQHHLQIFFFPISSVFVAAFFTAARSNSPLHTHMYMHGTAACKPLICKQTSPLVALFLPFSFTLFSSPFLIHPPVAKEMALAAAPSRFYLIATQRLSPAQMKSLPQIPFLIYLNHLSTPSKKVLQYQKKKKKGKKSVNVK